MFEAFIETKDGNLKRVVAQSEEELEEAVKALEKVLKKQKLL